MKLLRHVWNDIRAGENIDTYATILGMCQWALDTESGNLVSVVRVSDLAFWPG